MKKLKRPVILKSCPIIWNLKHLMISANELSVEVEKGKWVPCRPIGAFGFIHRLKATWLVFSGRADAVTWPNGQ